MTVDEMLDEIDKLGGVWCIRYLGEGETLVMLPPTGGFLDFHSVFGDEGAKHEFGRSFGAEEFKSIIKKAHKWITTEMEEAL